MITTKMLTRETLKGLLKAENSPCVSLYMPVNRFGNETAQNAIRLKNLLNQARKELAALKMPQAEVENLLRPIQTMQEGAHQWSAFGDGLCLFCSPGFFEEITVPVHFEEQLIVGPRFHVKPLVRALAEDGRFFVLALSQNKARFFSGSRFNVQEVEVEGLPEGLAEILSGESYERNVQFHTRTPPGRGDGERRAAMFYGQSDTEVEEREKVLQYFREVDRGLHELLREEKHPLVLASVENIMPLYRHANSYPHLLREGVEGNPDRMSAQEIHEKAWTVVEKYLLDREKDATHRYRELRGGHAVAEDVSDAVRAAWQARIDTVFVPSGQKVWGAFNPDTNEIRFEPETRNGSEDLLNFISVHTLISGGSVIAVPPERMPVSAPVAASLRY